MNDKHLKETLIKWFKIPGSAQWDEKVTNKIITHIKQSIALDTEADRLFCKEVVRKQINAKLTCWDCFGRGFDTFGNFCKPCKGTGKIEGKGVEGEQFNQTESKP